MSEGAEKANLKWWQKEIRYISRKNKKIVVIDLKHVYQSQWIQMGTMEILGVESKIDSFRTFLTWKLTLNKSKIHEKIALKSSLKLLRAAWFEVFHESSRHE